MASTVWKGYLTFGMVSLPVRLYRAARADRVPLRQIARRVPSSSRDRPIPPTQTSSEQASIRALRSGGSQSSSWSGGGEGWAPARQTMVSPEHREGEPEGAVQISKGFEYSKNRFVEVTAEELKSVAAQRSSEMVIEEFVALSEIDPVFFETSYYIAPEEVGEKAYALLFRCLRESRLVALANVAMHGREHVVVLRPGRSGLLAHTMFYLNEVHADEEFVADPSLVTGKEVALATQLVASLTANFDPSRYADSYRERLQALIDGKVEPRAAVAEFHVPRSQRQVVDIAEALRQSIKDLKKPAARQSAPAEKSAKRRKSMTQTAS